MPLVWPTTSLENHLSYMVCPRTWTTVMAGLCTVPGPAWVWRLCPAALGPCFHSWAELEDYSPRTPASHLSKMPTLESRQCWRGSQSALINSGPGQMKGTPPADFHTVLVFMMWTLMYIHTLYVCWLIFVPFFKRFSAADVQTFASVMLTTNCCYLSFE